MSNIMNIVMLVSLVLNLIGVLLTVSSKIISKSFKIDGGTFSDPNSGGMEIDLGIKYRVGWWFLLVGICLQILVTGYQAYKVAYAA